MNDTKWVDVLTKCYESYAEDISNKNKESSEKFFKNHVNDRTINFLIKNMNSLLTEIKQSKKQEEIDFIKSLSDNFINIPFLKMDNGKIKRTDVDNSSDSSNMEKKTSANMKKKTSANMKKKTSANMEKNSNISGKFPSNETVEFSDGRVKFSDRPVKFSDGSRGLDINVQLAGNGDETQLVKTMKGLQSIRIQIASLNASIIVARDQNNHDLAAKLTTQLQQLIMIENMAEQRQQALDIMKSNQDLKNRKDTIDQFKRCFFTGFAGVTSYYILKLFKDAGRLITGTAVGVVNLICVGVMSAISNTINGVTNNLPRIMGGGGNVMNSGRDIVGNFTQGVGDYVGGTQEVEQFIIQARELGYSTNIVAFMILFSITMIIFHCIRIFENADNLSLGFVRVGTNVVNPQLPPLPPRLNNGNEIVLLSDQIKQLNENVSRLNDQTSQTSQTNTLQDSRPGDNTGGYKKKRTRQRGRNRKKRKKRTKRRHHLYKNKK